MNEDFAFDFDFGDASSAEMLNNTKRELLNRKVTMGGEDKAVADEETRETERFFDELKKGKLEYPRASPTVFPLDADYFKQNSLPIPKNYDVLTAQAKFYWVELPVFLVPGPRPFYKMQMWMGFGEGISEGTQIPKVHSAFPEKRFVDIAAADGKVVFGLGEDLEFEVAAGVEKVALPTSIPIVDASAGGKLGVNAEVASSVGFVAGPFSYTVRRARVECRLGGEQVLWTITDKQSLNEDNPVFIVILQVPKKVRRVQLEARVQAHRKAPLPGFIASVLDRISPKSADWLKKGSPIALPLYSHSINTR